MSHSKQLDLSHLVGTHDLSLPAWGPYSKHYMGFSHVPDVASGYRFDLSAMPGIYRYRVAPPHVLKKGPYRPWLASADFTYCQDRHELDGKLFWCDTSYTQVDGAVLFCAEYHNQSDRPVSADLRLLGALYPAAEASRCTDALRPAVVQLSGDAEWIHALSYREGTFPSMGHREHLSYDGTRRGEIKASGLVDGYALSLAQGDCVTYDWAKGEARCFLRYRTPGQTAKVGTLTFSGALQGTIALAEAPDGAICPLSLKADASCSWLKVVNDGAAVLLLEGFVRGEGKVEISERVPNREPVVHAVETPETLLLEYSEIKRCYALRWAPGVATSARYFECDDLDQFLHQGDNGVHIVSRGRGEGFFSGVYAGPILVNPGDVVRYWAWVSTSALPADTADLIKDRSLQDGDCLALRDAARASAELPQLYPEGEDFRASIERMAATTVTNIVYPVRTRGTYIRHHAPGKNWDSLYTWDSGFIGLGLLELDPQRGLENLNAYLTEPGDPEAAFIHHGSPVPTQFFLFWELWNRFGDTAFLKWAFPRLAQYHRFLMGRGGKSITRNLRSGLLRTWDYFYNSGGWDDYPAQVHVSLRHPELRASVTPVINSALAVRTARMLARAALQLGESAVEFERDIEELTAALQDHSWDPEARVFSYVCHGPDGQPTEPLRHSSGENFNRGLDGCMPLVSGGVCTPEQETSLIEILFDPKHLWTDVGLSTVDQKAAYYQEDGYWNGGVWLPHQWMLWKALLDCGEGDKAFQIAKTGLDVWRRETDYWGDCFEHFSVHSGNGGGWSHFSGLSTPVISWMAAYYFPVRMTAGFDVLLREVVVDHSEASARVSVDSASHHKPVVLVNLARAAKNVTARLDNQILDCRHRHGACYEVSLPAAKCEGLLSVTSA